MNAIDVLAIILSVVSLIITIVGFFASLRFYRDGMQLQTSANDALIKIAEKTQSIQTQVGGMFERTLDAAIGKRSELSQNFEEINQQLEEAKSKLIQEAAQQIGAIGENESNRLTQIVNGQMQLIREKVELTKESLENLSSSIMSVNYLDNVGVLEVAFFDGTKYQYYDVPRRILDWLKEANSIDDFYSYHVKNKYNYRKIEW